MEHPRLKTTVVVRRALSLLSCLALGGCASATSASVPSTGAPRLPARCPASAFSSVPAEQWRAARSVLAPSGATAIRLCRYSGLNAHPRLSLARSRLLRDHSLVRRVVSDFDRLPAPPKGAISCPNDDGSQIAALLAYPGGRQVTVTVGLAGCNAVMNGSVQRTAMGFGSPPAYGPQLLVKLKELTRPRPPRRRTSAGAGGSASAAALGPGHWSVLARSPLGARFGATVIWDGHELLELGGTAGGRGGGVPKHDGAAYDPSLRRWQRVAAAPPAVMTGDAASAWTGHEAFVFGEPLERGEAFTGVAGLFDPAANRWTVSGRAPVGRLVQAGAVWNGRQVILAGVRSGTQPRLEAAAYDPASDKWTRLDPPVIAGHQPDTMAIVATGDGVLLWSLWGASQRAGRRAFNISGGVDVFRREAGAGWLSVTGSWPQSHTVDDPVFTGKQILLAPGQIWCGLCSHPAPFDEHGYIVDPVTLRRTQIPHGPLDDIGPQILWSGAAEISFNNGGEIIGRGVSVLPGDLAIWNPSTRHWVRGPRAPRRLGDMPAVWSGRSLLVLARDGELLSYGR